MALKSFTHDCLNDNWFEERATPLNGVIGDYKERCFDTTHKGAYVGEQSKVLGATRASRMKALVQTKGTGALAMSQLETYSHVTADRTTSAPEVGFGALLASSRAAEAERHMKTSSEVAYGARKRVTATEKKLLKQPDAPVALGRGGARNERGISTSGAIGEVFKEGHDPQHNTAVQRSWVYQPDPMLKVKFEGMPDAPQHDSTSLALNHNTAFNPNASHAKSRSITGHFDHVGVPTHGKIYLDD